MRVISGKLKGRRLKGFKAEHIRPTTDRVKESVFNILGPSLEEARVLDLFSGTGSLSIEAWSRGASYIECVELSKKSLAILRSNLKELGLGASTEIALKNQDVFRYLKSFKGPPYFDLVIADPPFTEKWADRVMHSLSESQVLASGGIAVIESSSRETIEDNYGQLQLLDRRGFGDKKVSFFRRV